MTSPTTESLTIETGLMRNMMEETQDSGEGEITVETRQSGRMEDRPSGGTHNAAIENETAGENNICRAENDFCDEVVACSDKVGAVEQQRQECITK